jgi:hypothetical protein
MDESTLFFNFYQRGMFCKLLDGLFGRATSNDRRMNGKLHYTVQHNSDDLYVPHIPALKSGVARMSIKQRTFLA